MPPIGWFPGVVVMAQKAESITSKVLNGAGSVQT